MNLVKKVTLHVPTENDNADNIVITKGSSKRSSPRFKYWTFIFYYLFGKQRALNELLFICFLEGYFNNIHSFYHSESK